MSACRSDISDEDHSSNQQLQTMDEFALFSELSDKTPAQLKKITPKQQQQAPLAAAAAGGKAKKKTNQQYKKEASKYELVVLYKKKSNGVVGAKKIYVGKRDALDSRTASDELIQEMQKKYAKLIISNGSSFDVEAFRKCDHFFNSKFWEANVCWTSKDFHQNLLVTDKHLRELDLVYEL